MISFIIKNIGTIAVLTALVVILAVIVLQLIKDKKNGKSIQCGCDCKNCSGHCH